MAGRTGSDPVGDHHVIGFQQLPAGLDPPRPGEPGRALDDRRASVLVAFDLGGVIQVPDHVIVIVPQPRPVDRGRGHPGDPAGLGPHLRASQQRLGRDARPVSALPADQLPLDDRDPPPGFEQPTGGGLAAHAHPDDDHIEPVHSASRGELTSHVCPPVRATTHMSQSRILSSRAGLRCCQSRAGRGPLPFAGRDVLVGGAGPCRAPAQVAEGGQAGDQARPCDAGVQHLAGCDSERCGQVGAGQAQG